MIIRFHIILRIFIDWFINSEKESLSLTPRQTPKPERHCSQTSSFTRILFFRTIKLHLFSVIFSSIYHRSNFPRTILASRQLATYSKTSTRDKLRWKKKGKGKNGGFSQFYARTKIVINRRDGKSRRKWNGNETKNLETRSQGTWPFM